MNQTSTLPMNETFNTTFNTTRAGEDDGYVIIALGCMLCIFVVVGTIGNALAFIIYYRKREKGTSTIFILCLTVTDFLTCLIAIPYTFAHEFVSYRYTIDIFCKIYMFIITFNIPLSSLFLVAIGFDRYFCICHPFLHIITVPRAKRIIFVMTIISILLGVVPFMSYSIYSVHTKVVDVIVPIDTPDPSLFKNQSAPEVTSLYSMMSSILPSADADLPAKTTTAPDPSSTTHLFTDGLFLNPDSNFLNEMEHAGQIPYKTGYAPFNQTSPGVLETTTRSTENAGNVLNYTIKSMNRSMIVKTGLCMMTTVTVSTEITHVYQKVYASIFLIEFIVIAILYALIYRSIILRRAWKAKRKQKSSYYAPNCVEGEDTQLTNINGSSANPNTDVTVVKKNPGRISAAMRDKTLYANVRTAAILFVVTVVFVLSFLPSWLMGLRVLELNKLVFYCFYFNNVANPIIYAFMNRTFRDELILLIKNCLCRRM